MGTLNVTYVLMILYWWMFRVIVIATWTLWQLTLTFYLTMQSSTTEKRAKFTRLMIFVQFEYLKFYFCRMFIILLLILPYTTCMVSGF